jgi:hypothetical protein
MSYTGFDDSNLWILSKYARFNFDDETWNVRI